MLLLSSERLFSCLNKYNTKILTGQPFYLPMKAIVAVGSTLTPGPIVGEIAKVLKNLPLDAAGRSFARVSMIL